MGVEDGMDSLLPMFFIWPLAWPSCLTPMVQHFAGALDAMIAGVS